MDTMNVQTERPCFLSIRQTAKTGLLSETALRRLHAKGRIPGFFSGNRFYVNRDLLEKWVDDPDSPLNKSE